jgi:SAM-dependent methyltransferase
VSLAALRVSAEGADAQAALFAALGPPTDLDLWVDLALTTGGPVLYVGAGVGRRALPLARRGLEIWALEQDAAAFRHLRARAEVEAQGAGRVHAVHGRLEEWDDDRSFGLVMAPSGVLNDCLTRNARHRFLSGCARRLRAGGVLALELLNPVYVASGRHESCNPGPDGNGQWVRTEIWCSAYDPVRQRATVCTMTERFPPGGAVSRAVEYGPVAVVLPEELALLVEAAGLSLASPAPSHCDPRQFTWLFTCMRPE